MAMNCAVVVIKLLEQIARLLKPIDVRTNKEINPVLN